jgi:hypothetical protein
MYDPHAYIPFTGMFHVSISSFLVPKTSVKQFGLCTIKSEWSRRTVKVVPHITEHVMERELSPLASVPKGGGAGRPSLHTL